MLHACARSLPTQYYEVVLEAAFRPAPLTDPAVWLVARAQRRYGLALPNPNITAAWMALAAGPYALDGTLSDGTGVAELPSPDTSHWSTDRATPGPSVCATWMAWGALIAAVPALGPAASGEPFVYDLINTGREVLAQLSTPLSQNFSAVLNAHGPLDAAALERTGPPYIELLRDLDALLATDSAFLLGPWLASARAWGEGDDDCSGTAIGNLSCPDFYAWNALCQLTTWYPTLPDASAVPQRDTDYARKHWSPLVADYYGARAELTLTQARHDAAAHAPLNSTAVKRATAELAYSFTAPPYPTFPLVPAPDPVGTSAALRAKYTGVFASCGPSR